MTNTISKFTFNAHALRTVEIDGEPWFHAVDVLRCLGLNVAKGFNSYGKRLDADEKRITREVLPAIRRTGGYLLNEAARETAHADERSD
jgi:prophage antirepressor-like protein